MITASAESFIIVLLMPLCLKIPTKNPSENSAGIVLSPNIPITIAPQNGLVVLAAMIANE